MQRYCLTFLLLATTASCAHAPSIPEAIHAVNVAAAAGDVAVQAASTAWAGYVDARIEVCAARGLQDAQAREACMAEGGAGPLQRDQVEQAFADIVAAQRELAAALQSASAAYERVRPLVDHAQDQRAAARGGDDDG